MSEPSYPLHWPASWPRAKSRTYSKFGKKGSGALMGRTLDSLERELHLLGAQHATISSNVKNRLDGKPYADRRPPEDPGVAVYFTLKDKRQVLACDKWDRAEDNLQAIVKHIEAIRGQARWGVGSIEQAFRGYMALEAPKGPDCWHVLRIPEPGATESRKVIETCVMAAWKARAKEVHPDVAPDKRAEWIELDEAKNNALAIANARP